MSSINLLPRHHKEKIQNERILKILRRLDTIFVIATIFMLLTLFALNIDTVTPEVRREQNATLSQLNLLHEKTAKILLAKERLGGVDKLLAKRSSLDTLIAQISLMVSDDMTIDEFSSDKTGVTIIVSSRSLLSLSDFIDTISDVTSKHQIFKSTTIDSLSADGIQNKYTLSLKGQLL